MIRLASIFFLAAIAFGITGAVYYATSRCSAHALSSVTAWIPYWDQSRALQAYRSQHSYIDTVSLFWYRLTPEGIITTYAETVEDPRIVREIQNNGDKAFGLIANLPDYSEGGTWDKERVRNAIQDDQRRKQHIEAIVRLAVEKNFDGIDIDYERLSGDMKEMYTTFIAELSAALRTHDKELGIAIHPKTGEGIPSEQNGSEAQDWSALHPHVDRMYFITYSEHYDGSEPGPNASIQWVNRVLSYAVDTIGIPRSKIVFGIPFYGHHWKTGSRGVENVSDDVTHEQALLLAQQHRAVLRYDTISQAPFFVFSTRESGATYRHEVWFENVWSFRAKRDLAERYRLTHIGVWRLGGEDMRIWSAISEWRRAKDSSMSP